MVNTSSVDYVAAGKDVAMQIAAMNPIALNKDGVDQTVIDKEIEIGKEQALKEGKPENIVEKIAQGKLQKFFKDNTLLSQPFVKDNSMTIESYLGTFSSELSVDKFLRVSIDNPLLIIHYILYLFRKNRNIFHQIIVFVFSNKNIIFKPNT